MYNFQPIVWAILAALFVIGELLTAGFFLPIETSGTIGKLFKERKTKKEGTTD